MTSPLSIPSNLHLGDILCSYSALLPKEVLINAVLELKLNRTVCSHELCTIGMVRTVDYSSGSQRNFSCVTAAAGVSEVCHSWSSTKIITTSVISFDNGHT